ncbi:MAG: hypothetical protein R2822_24370 [Spirosomataceae bacterium]
MKKESLAKVVKVVSTNADGTAVYAPNDIIVSANQLYGYNNPRRYHEAVIYDGSYVATRNDFGYFQYLRRF